MSELDVNRVLSNHFGNLSYFLTLDISRMCTFIGQIVFGGIMLVALGLTLGAMFTPEWRRITNTQGGSTDGSAGLFDFNCQFDNPNQCASLFNSRPTWEKVGIANNN